MMHTPQLPATASPPRPAAKSPRRRAGSISNAAVKGRSYVLVLVGLLAAALVFECARHLIRTEDIVQPIDDDAHYLPMAAYAPGDAVGPYSLKAWSGPAGAKKPPAPIEGPLHYTPALPHPGDACAMTESTPGAQTSFRWAIKKRLNRGAHGEVWAATREDKDYVLKHMFLEKGAHVRLAAAREAWFGDALKGHFVEHFATARGDRWLVFAHAGRSLHDHLFEVSDSSGVLKPTRAWRQLRLDADGPRKFAELCVGLLRATADVHAHNVVHRDVDVASLLRGDGPTNVFPRRSSRPTWPCP
jgi:hypothetical protein